MSRDRRPPIHPSIKKRLGYGEDEPDGDVLRDWRGRLRRVCKPCWELKYCPYGPLVEQSPLLPPERAGTIEHIERLERALATDQLGEIEEVTEERRQSLKEWIADEEILIEQVLYQMWMEERDAAIAATDNPAKTFEDSFGPLPPIHEYRVSYDLGEGKRTEEKLAEMSPERRKEVRSRLKDHKKKLAAALKTGVEDNRKPLDAARRAWFERQVRDFRADDYPEDIPDVFRDGERSVFGHICPVFFAAEAITETSEERRRGRYIPFAVKMRVVRRDNHTCQHCGKHLRDPESGIRPQNSGFAGR